jgi:hypothetical protein
MVQTILGDAESDHLSQVHKTACNPFFPLRVVHRLASELKVLGAAIGLE